MTVFDDITLLRYVEDDLLPAEREIVARRLANDLDAQQKIQMLRSTGDVLRRTFSGQLGGIYEQSVAGSIISVPKAGPAHPKRIRQIWPSTTFTRGNAALVFSIGILFLGVVGAVLFAQWPFYGSKVARGTDPDSPALYGSAAHDQPNVSAPAPQQDDMSKFLDLITRGDPNIRLPRDWKSRLFGSKTVTTQLEIEPNIVITSKITSTQPGFDGGLCRLIEVGIAGTPPHRILGCAKSDADWETATITVLSE